MGKITNQYKIWPEIAYPFSPSKSSRKMVLCLFVCLFVWFNSLRPINNLSVQQGWVFLGWTSTKLGWMCLAQGPQCSDAGEAQTRGSSVSSQALYHWFTKNGAIRYEIAFFKTQSRLSIHKCKYCMIPVKSWFCCLVLFLFPVWFCNISLFIKGLYDGSDLKNYLLMRW